MKLGPIAKDIGREAVIVVAGSILAAYIVGEFPRLRAWMRRQWGEER